MAEIDVIIQQFLMDYVLVVIYLGIALYVAKSLYPKTKKWIVWQQLHESERCYAEMTRYQRQELLAPLHRLISADIFLRNQGIIRIVDIGVMTGINIRYFPNSTHVVAVDTRYNLEYFFKPIATTLDHVRIKECVEYNHIDLKKIPDEYADAVVGSFVLCKAKDEATILKEIYRILAPNC
ncbi:hypothetical protein R5R35_005222 [Gryllus longicercus]|uniref:Methyltransferase type 11 domain-containing protein n=1 Tax=Gryllus longicercus TaxID=2509291 RepID=A0AAN9VGP7_9ORTH